MDGLTAGRILDLSHSIEPGMITYPGLPAPAVSEFLSREAAAAKYAPGTTFSIGRVDLVANTGTYVDAPFHRFAEGADIAALGDEAGVAETTHQLGPGARVDLEL